MAKDSKLLVLLMLELCQSYIEIRGKDKLTINPWPVLVMRKLDTTLTIWCGTDDPGYQSLNIGVDKTTGSQKTQGITNILYSVTKNTGHPYQYSNFTQRHKSYKPDGHTEVHETTDSLALIIISASLRDLDNQWACVVRHGDISSITNVYPVELVQAIPFPENNFTKLTVEPAKETYDSWEIDVRLACRAIVKMDFKLITSKLTHVFQYFDSNQWFTIDERDRLQVQKITKGAIDRQGKYRWQTHTLVLKVFSIPGCSRTYRCLMTYGETEFVKDMPEVTINVTPCTGGCFPDNITCQAAAESTTASGKHPDGNTQKHPDKTEGVSATLNTTSGKHPGGNEDASPAFDKQIMVTGVSLSAGVTLFIVILFLLVYCERRKQAKESSARPMETIRSQMMDEPSVLKEPPGVSDTLATSDADQSMESESACSDACSDTSGLSAHSESSGAYSDTSALSAQSES